jgi:signal transduction histidine kinase/CheY-like chemotaxis protein
MGYNLKWSLRKMMAVVRWETEDRELLQSVSSKVMGTTLAVYVAWHIIATLGWTQIFSPSLYLITLGMAVIGIGCFRLMHNFYLLSQLLWNIGITAMIILAYRFYHQPDILLILCFLPIMAEVMMGIKPTLVLAGSIVVLAMFWNGITFLPPLNSSFQIVLLFSTLTATALGWGISYNLVVSIEAASHHYREAVQRLNEAREHRAEISVLLKDVNNANYQLDRMNLMLSYARGQADKAREERDRFALAVSHELRSPLNFIIGFSDLMVNSPEIYDDPKAWPPGLYDDIKEIYKSSTHLMQLINDILDMGKMDAKQFTVFKEKIDFAVIVEDVREMVQNAVNNKGLELRIDLAPDLPPVFVDRTRIRQVLLNLVTNSLRFTRQGSITIKAFKSTPEMLRVEVIDTGTGIAKKDLPKVFHEFRQVGDDNLRSGEGGLGLSIGQRFVRLHSGEMGVESEPGKGSIFHFTVQFHQEIDDVDIINEDSTLEAARDMAAVSLEKVPLLLMLAQDAFSARVFVKAIKGYKVTILTDPAQLTPVVERTFPTAVIVDENLAKHPKVMTFAENPPYDLPIVTFELPVSRQNRTSNLPEGVVDYLVKPVPRHVLVESVKKVSLKVNTILVVDDDPSMARFVAQALKSNEEDQTALTGDIKILTALDGQEALRYLHSIPVGVVFLDLDLTDMNGLTLLNQMLQDRDLRQIPVVIISASDPPATFSPQQKGIFSVLVNRPYDRNELIELVDLTLHEIKPVYSRSNTSANLPAENDTATEKKQEVNLEIS